MFRQAIDGLFELIYPRTCAACGKALTESETDLCLPCITLLPYTFDYLSPTDNPMFERIMAPELIDGAFSLMVFEKGGPAQKILHELKYRGREGVGEKMGVLLAQQLANAGFINQFDVVLPIPLHPKKLKIRGYNQVDGFANALAKALNADFLPNGLTKNKHTDTQTKKNAAERQKNVAGIYQIGNHNLANKRILVADDVSTTGATFIEVAKALKQANAAQVWVCSIAATHLN